MPLQRLFDEVHIAHEATHLRFRYAEISLKRMTKLELGDAWLQRLVIGLGATVEGLAHLADLLPHAEITRADISQGFVETMEQGVEHVLRDGVTGFWEKLVDNHIGLQIMQYELLAYSARKDHDSLAQQQYASYTSVVAEFCEQAARADGFTRMELMATMAGVPLYEVCGYRPIEQVLEILRQEREP